MKLAENIEHGKIAKFFPNGKSRMRYKRFQKKLNIRTWRRFKGDLKPMYGRYNGWEF